MGVHKIGYSILYTTILPYPSSLRIGYLADWIYLYIGIDYSHPFDDHPGSSHVTLWSPLIKAQVLISISSFILTSFSLASSLTCPAPPVDTCSIITYSHFRLVYIVSAYSNSSVLISISFLILTLSSLASSLTFPAPPAVLSLSLCGV